MENRDDGTCKARIGLLFLRDCGALTVENCHVCGKSICKKHRLKSKEGVYCMECRARTQKGKDNKELEPWRRRQALYEEYHYMPIYYGHYHYYSDHDYRTFDDYEPMEVERPSANIQDREFLDQDEMMES